MTDPRALEPKVPLNADGTARYLAHVKDTAVATAGKVTVTVDSVAVAPLMRWTGPMNRRERRAAERKARRQGP